MVFQLNTNTHFKLFSEATDSFIIFCLQLSHALAKLVHHDLSITTGVALKDSIMEKDILALWVCVCNRKSQLVATVWAVY